MSTGLGKGSVVWKSSYDLLVSFEPCFHFSASVRSFSRSFAACFAAAASAFLALPAAFLVFSPPPFLPGMVDADDRDGLVWIKYCTVDGQKFHLTSM